MSRRSFLELSRQAESIREALEQGELSDEVEATLRRLQVMTNFFIDQDLDADSMALREQFDPELASLDAAAEEDDAYDVGDMGDNSNDP